MSETPLGDRVAGGYTKDQPKQEIGYVKGNIESHSTTIHALSSLSFSVDQIVDLFGAMVDKLQPILGPDGGSPAEDPMTVTASTNSHIFKQLLGNEVKLNYLAAHIQDVTRRIDL